MQRLPQLLRRLRLPGARLSTAASSASAAPPVSLPPEQAARMKAMHEAVARSVRAGKEALGDAFGGPQQAEQAWSSEYYRHAQHKFLVPALSMAVEAAERASSPALIAKHAVFYAGVLRALAGEDFSASAHMLPAVEGMPLGTLVDVLGGVDTVQGRAVFARLCGSLERRGGAEVEALLAHSRAVPRGTPVPQWPFPHLDTAALLAAAAGEGGMAAWKPAPGEAPRAYELTGLSPRLREACDGPTWLLHAATTVLECQWGHFYATGDGRALAAVLAAALPWAATGAAALPGAPAYLIDLEKPLPGDFTLTAGQGAEATLRAIQAAVARAAQWGLLMHSRRHPAVVRAVAEACRGLAPYLAEPSARGAEGELQLLTEEQVRHRLEVWPPLLHLMARGRLDAPFKEGDDA